ncbi:PadR family transcriptional regulator [uncultured Amnibacterium sp.]|uniref:PadR family transcriptional regulator n=1 Tax=uncultured Amnibacterium sp. TaxID=1631851 RepID=UPI0035CB0DE0
MSVRQGLLAVLAEGPCYLFQLRNEFHRRTGSSLQLNAGQVSTTLDRLERDGLVVRSADSDGQVWFSTTEQGRSEVRTWLGRPVARSATTRDELTVKLAIAVTLPGVEMAEVLEVQRLECLRHLQDLTRTKQAGGEPTSGEDLAWLMTVDSLIFAGEAELQWLDHCEARLERARAAGVSLTFPISNERPRAGRPSRAGASS